MVDVTVTPQTIDISVTPVEVTVEIAQGLQGFSAYEIAVQNGFVGDEAAWLASLVGEQGTQGEQGPIGITGAIGPQGIQGVKGDTGDTGPKGDKGDTGNTGASGSAATVSVGTVTTGNAGSSANVVNVGTSSSAVFNFTIPRGDTGAQGIQGDTGPTGAKGDTGDAGPAGTAATIAVGTVTTGIAGSSASITNVGTSSAATFNFTIPRGDTGATGAAGSNGTNGVDGNDGWSPVLAVATDGTRRLLQVSDWVGGEGTKPATGDYVGASGLTSNIASAVDIRGTTGATGATGSTGPSGAPAVTYSVTGTIDFGLTDSDTASTTISAAWAGTIPYTIRVSPYYPDHDIEDVVIETIVATAYEDTGVGFDVYAHAPEGSWGRYTITILGYS